MSVDVGPEEGPHLSGLRGTEAALVGGIPTAGKLRHQQGLEPVQSAHPEPLGFFRMKNYLKIHIKHNYKELAKGLGEILNKQNSAALQTPQVGLI